MSEGAPTPWWRTPFGLALCGFVLIGACFLITEHAAHLAGVLPYLLLAACPLMHLFMHHGHHHHHDGDTGDKSQRLETRRSVS
jgi:hypothetical protein